MTRLEAIRERANAAPKGDWYVEGDGSVWVDHSGGESFSMSGLTGALPVWAEGAGPFIAHAPADIAALTAAVEGVIALHYEGEDLEEVLPQACIDGPCEHADDLCPEVTIKPCMECSIPGEYYVEYPCPTVVTITTALDSQP